jgi:hypothetical protein
MNVGRMARQVYWRVRLDYVSPGRVEDYAKILRQAREAGYRLISLEQYVDSLRKNQMPGPALVLRHDVDIADVEGDTAILKEEIRNGARATYYFRLDTARTHSELIRQLVDQGFDVGYHFEEAASLAKKHHWRSRDDLFAHRDEIQAAFRRNCERVRTTWSPRMRSASQHGDWINRKLGVSNKDLIDGPTREACGLEFEAYDDEILNSVDVYVSDVATPPERWARGVSPLGAIQEGKRRIYMLTHERWWNAGRVAKVRADAGRVWETVRYALGA